jgi:hypothetical protein
MMRTAIAIILLAGSIGTASPAAAAPSLDGTWWAGNPTCSISDLLFKADGDVVVLYADGGDRFGRWTLRASVLTIDFADTSETFLARFSGSQIRVAHAWRESPREPLQEEQCVFGLQLKPNT